MIVRYLLNAFLSDNFAGRANSNFIRFMALAPGPRSGVGRARVPAVLHSPSPQTHNVNYPPPKFILNKTIVSLALASLPPTQLEPIARVCLDSLQGVAHPPHTNPSTAAQTHPCCTTRDEAPLWQLPSPPQQPATPAQLPWVALAPQMPIMTYASISGRVIIIGTCVGTGAASDAGKARTAHWLAASPRLAPGGQAVEQSGGRRCHGRNDPDRADEGRIAGVAPPQCPK
jgi:hypothetical protein